MGAKRVVAVPSDGEMTEENERNRAESDQEGEGTRKEKRGREKREIDARFEVPDLLSLPQFD
jgi:hypothetical protein